MASGRFIQVRVTSFDSLRTCHTSHCSAIFRTNVLAQLLPESFMAAEPRRRAFVRGIHVPSLHAAFAAPELLADDVDLHHAAVLRSR